MFRFTPHGIMTELRDTAFIIAFIARFIRAHRHLFWSAIKAEFRGRSEDRKLYLNELRTSFDAAVDNAVRKSVLN